MASLYILRPHTPRRHRGGRPGWTAALPVPIALLYLATDQARANRPLRPVQSPQLSRRRLLRGVNRIQFPTHSLQRSRPNRRQQPRGPASPELAQRVRAARLPPQASIWPPSCRRVLGLRIAAVLAGHGNQTSGPRAACRPPPASLPSPPGVAACSSPAVGSSSVHRRRNSQSQRN